MNEREYARKNNDVFAENDEFILRIPTMEDMDGYLLVEVANDPSMSSLLDADDSDAEWFKGIKYKTFNNDNYSNFHLSIIDKKNNDYLGEINIQGYKSDVPEIGITLLEQYRFKGIGARVITLYMDKCKDIRNIMYFSARIDKDNIASQKMIAKLNSSKKMQIQDYYCYEICS